MRKVFNKVMAGAMTTALVATLAVGFKTNTTDVKADTANALTGSWTSLAESYEPNDAVITQTTFKSTAVDNVSANISITGWQANWTAESAAPEDAIVLNDNIWGERPYQITSKINAKVVPGNTYKLKFTVNNGMMEADTTTKTEKNITITVNSGIEGDDYNTMLFKTITVPAGATETYEFDVPVSADYLSNDIQVQLAYGSYMYSYELTQAVKAGKVTEEAAKACKYAYAYGTSEKVNAHGTLAFTDISLMGEKYTQSVIPETPKPTERPTAMQQPTTTTDVKADTANALTGSWTSSAESYEPNDAVITQTTFKSTAVDNVSANISITGWQAIWTAESAAPEDAIVLNDNIWGERPYQITSKINAKVVPGNTYKLKFTVNNGMMEADTTIKTEKNITITVNSGIEGDNDNTMLFKTITVPAGATETYEFDVPVSADYLSNDIQVQLAYGSYMYSYELTQAVKAGKVTEEAAKACKYAYAYGTSEKVNAHGTLAFTDISLMGEKYKQSVIPERPKPTERPTAMQQPTTKVPEETTTQVVITERPKPTEIPTAMQQPTTKVPEETTTQVVLTTTVQQETTTQVAPTTIVPVETTKATTIGKVKIKSAKATKKKSAKVTWKKVSGVKQYQVQYSLNKKFKKSKIKKTGKLTIVLSKLAGGKKYYVRVRAVSGTKKGAWSQTKTFKTSK